MAGLIDTTSVTAQLPQLPHHRGETILLVEVGSTLHGTGLPGGEDLDLMGVALAAPAYTVGLKDDWGHWIWRTQPEGERSGPGDIDLAIYSAAKWLNLALKGNPSVMLPIYAPETHVHYATEVGLELRELARRWLPSQEAGRRFAGYLMGQRKRFNGETAQHGRIRRHLVGIHGYDTKYGMHMVRLAHQGIEFMLTGTLELPMVGERAEECRSIRRGEMERAELDARIDQLDAELQVAIEETSLPDRANWEEAGEWLARRQLRHAAASLATCCFCGGRIVGRESAVGFYWTHQEFGHEWEQQACADGHELAEPQEELR